MHPEDPARRPRPSTGPRTGTGPTGGVRVLPLAGGTRPVDVSRMREALSRTLDPDGGPPDVVLLPHRPEISGPQALAEAGLVSAPGSVPGLVDPATVPPGTAVLLRTSGSTTGHGRLVALKAEALIASARATEQRLTGRGRWLLALPVHHVAGLQVLVRSWLAGTDPVVLDTSSGFDPRALAGAVASRPDEDDAPWYTSLVPTQLARVLDAGEDAVAPLRRLAAVLVGGAASDPHVLGRARDAGLAVVTTYGMTETSGGCVYDGVPLPGVEVALEPGTARVRIAGPVLAAGYVGDAETQASFVLDAGRRWLRTADHGELVEDAAGQQVLRVLGRVDDVINTGGVKVSPALVEAALADLGAEVAVVGVPDPEWGELVTVVVVTPEGHDAPSPSLTEMRRAVERRLDRTHAPRASVSLRSLPLHGPGKVDRRTLARVAADLLARPGTSGTERYPGTTASPA